MPHVVQETLTGDAAMAAASVRPSGEPLSSDQVSHRHIRGSSLLVAGRGIAVALNFAFQILTVRYLTKSDYGAFAYALGVASIASTAILLGLGRALPRLLPIYLERTEFGRAFGAMTMAAGTVLGLGVSLVLILHGASGWAAAVVSEQSLPLLLILIVMAPLDALDNLLQNIAAVFVGAKAIFFRRQVLGPGMRLLAILFVMTTTGDARLLAFGYVAGGFVGAWLYIAVLVRDWRRRELLRFLAPGRQIWAAREVFSFSVPLMSSELAVLWRGPLAVLLLEYFRSTTSVAEYRAVLPVAGLNLMIFEAFAFMFVPQASRLFARGDYAGVAAIYWKTSTWIAVLTFPVVTATIVFSEPLSVLLFGRDYAGAGLLLAVLSVGFYVSATLGFNAAALRVHGRVHTLLVIDLTAAALAVAGNALLITLYGALGAAIATSAVLTVHALITHAAMRTSGIGVPLFDRAFLRVHAAMAAVLVPVVLAKWLAEPSPAADALLVLLASLVLIRLTRRDLGAAAAFPELMRVPGLRWLIGPGGGDR